MKSSVRTILGALVKAVSGHVAFRTQMSIPYVIFFVVSVVVEVAILIVVSAEKVGGGASRGSGKPS